MEQVKLKSNLGGNFNDNPLKQSIFSHNLTPEIEMRKNLSLLLFHSAIQNFLRLENSSEEIQIDYNFFQNN